MPHSPLLKLALRLHGRYGQYCPGIPQPLDSLVQAVLDHTRRLQRQRELSDHARQRHWLAAARNLERNQLAVLNELRYLVTGSALQPSPKPQTPTLRLLHEELLALEQEFDHMVIEPGMLAVTTDPVELEGVELGAFRIELNLNELFRRMDVSAFSIVAVDPHPPAVSDDITHPHVRDQSLCAGEATVPISRALADGRLCDAFILINQVLHTYNSSSAYVTLEDWEGRTCGDCGRSMRDDDAYTCTACGCDCCGDCSSFCDCCEDCHCRDCLNEDPVSDRLICSECQRRCSACGRIVDCDSFIEESQLCPGCDEKRLEQEEEQAEQAEQEQIDVVQVDSVQVDMAQVANAHGVAAV